MMSYFGFYAGKLSNTEGKLMKIVSVISISFSIMLTVAMGVRIVLSKNSFNIALESFHIFATQIAFLIKLILFIRNLPIFYELEDFLESNIFVSKDIYIKLIEEETKGYKRLAKSYHICCWGCSLLYILAPLLDGQMLPIPIWFPGNSKNYRFGLYVYEICCYIITSANNPSIDCISVGLITFMAAQFHVLAHRLEHDTFTDTVDNSLLQERNVKKELRHCIEHHIAIKQYDNYYY